MSIGLYIITSEEFQEFIKNDDFESLNELLQKGYSQKELLQYLKNMGINAKEINPNEKIFYIDDDQFSLSFQIIKTLNNDTINKYLKYMKTKSCYCYEVIIEKPDIFYSEFLSYLKSYNVSFEIWKIWEDLYEPENIKIFNFQSISEQNLKIIIENNCYINPILGRFCL